MTNLLVLEMATKEGLLSKGALIGGGIFVVIVLAVIFIYVARKKK